MIKFISIKTFFYRKYHLCQLFFLGVFEIYHLFWEHKCVGYCLECRIIQNKMSEYMILMIYFLKCLTNNLGYNVITILNFLQII